MRNSNSKLEVSRLNSNLKGKSRASMRIVDFCTYALLQNKNYSMTCAQLKTAIKALGYKTDGRSLDRTISTILRYQNYGMVDLPRNAKFRLKRSVVRKLTKRSAKRKLNAIFRTKK